MNDVLKNPLKVREKENGRSEWSFKAPSYDNRTSSSIPAGNYYGIGHRTPIGKESASPISSGPIPQKSHCFSPNEIFEHEDKRG
jgi:hypothetical protein